MSNLGGKSHAPGGAGGAYTPPAHTTSTVQKSYSETEKAGLVDGVSALEKTDTEDHGPMYDYTLDPISGNAPERPEPYAADKVSSKGNSFDVC